MSARLDEYAEAPSPITSRELIAWLQAEPGQPLIHNGRRVGAIYKHPTMGKIYATIRDKSEHVYRKWNSVGISRDVLIKLINLQVKTILIVFKDTSEVYTTTTEKFITQGKCLWFDSESDSQLHLPISSMTRIP